MKQKMRNLLLMKLAKTQQDEQEGETDGPLNEHRAPTKETCIQAIIFDHQNVSIQAVKYKVLHQEKTNTQYHL